MREGAWVAIAEQPGDLRNANVALAEILLREAQPQILQHVEEADTFAREAARERAVAQPHALRDIRERRLAMRQQRHHGVLDLVAPVAGADAALRQGLLAIGEQQLIEIGI